MEIHKLCIPEIYIYILEPGLIGQLKLQEATVDQMWITTNECTQMPLCVLLLYFTIKI